MNRLFCFFLIAPTRRKTTTNIRYSTFDKSKSMDQRVKLNILTVSLANETNLYHLFLLVLHLPFQFKMELKQAKLSSMFMFTYYPDM